MNLILRFIGAIGAIWYVGYFAYSVNETPLTVIVVLCLSLMLFAFYRDIQKDRAVAAARSESGK